MRTLTLCITALASLFLLSGCATMELQTQAKRTRTLTLPPEVLNDKRVFVRVSGTEASILELEAPLKQALSERHVTVVSSIDDATLYLHVNTLFANNLKEATNINAALMTGTIAGAAASVNNSGKDSILIGIGVALAMGVADKALADETYRAVVDVSLTERNRASQEKPWKKAQETRVLVEAVKMNLDTTEAKPILEQKVVSQIADIFK